METRDGGVELDYMTFEAIHALAGVTIYADCVYIGLKKECESEMMKNHKSP